jgi:hypothetical protein
MRIDLTNYEHFILDYLEGRMTLEGEQLMKKFLISHPDIKEEIEEYDASLQIPVSSSVAAKTALFKSFSDIRQITSENFEEFCIAHFERDLEESAEKLLSQFLTDHPDKKSSFELYGKLKFSPDKKINYPAKSKLRKQVIITFRRIILATVASAAAILIVIFFPSDSTKSFLSKENMDRHGIAENNATVVQPDNLVGKEIKNTHPVFRHFKHQVIQHARSDSGNSSFNEKAIIASMQPLQPAIENYFAIAHSEPIVKNISLPQEKEDPMTNKPPRDKKPSEHIRSRDFKNKMILSIVHAGIAGVNKLTENDLSLQTRQASDGKLSAFALESDNFEISRKINRNMQN